MKKKKRKHTPPVTNDDSDDNGAAAAASSNTVIKPQPIKPTLQGVTPHERADSISRAAPPDLTLVNPAPGSPAPDNNDVGSNAGDDESGSTDETGDSDDNSATESAPAPAPAPAAATSDKEQSAASSAVPAATSAVPAASSAVPAASSAVPVAGSRDSDSAAVLTVQGDDESAEAAKSAADRREPSCWSSFVAFFRCCSNEAGTDAGERTGLLNGQSN